MMLNPDNPTNRLDLLKRWLSKVEERCGNRCAEDGSSHSCCWIWTAGTNGKNYPAIRAGKQIVYAHRLAHELFIGELPSNTEVHHRCLNHRCVNPAHLLGTTPQLNRFLQAAGGGDPEELDIPI